MIKLQRYNLKNFPHEKAIVLTNSERSSMSCLRFWAYSYVQNVETNKTNSSLSYGIIVHQFLEMVLNKVIETGVLPSVDVIKNLNKIYTLDFIEKEDPDGLYDSQEILTKINRSIYGWHKNFSKLLKEWKVVGVELELNTPIYDKYDSIYEVRLHTTSLNTKNMSYSRLSRIGEHNTNEDTVPLIVDDNELRIVKEEDCDVELKVEKLPFYVAGKLDCLLQSRKNPKMLAVLDHKTSSSLGAFTSKIKYDVQLPTYAYLVEDNIKRGILELPKDSKVTHVFYDLLTNKKIELPSPLKNGKLSSRAACPSWLYKQAITVNDLNINNYLEVIKDLEYNDQKYFTIISRELFTNDVKRIKSELLGVAKRITKTRNKLSTCSVDDESLFDEIAPRNTQSCTQWGNCKYSQVCLDSNLKDVILIHEPNIKFNNGETI